MEDGVEASLYCNAARMLMHLNIKYPNFSVIGGGQVLPAALNRISVFSHMVTALLWRRSGDVDRAGVNNVCGLPTDIKVGEIGKVLCDNHVGRFVYIRSVKSEETRLSLCEVYVYEKNDSIQKKVVNENLVVESCSVSQNSFEWDAVSARVYTEPNCTGDAIEISKFNSRVNTPIKSIQLASFTKSTFGKNPGSTKQLVDSFSYRSKSWIVDGNVEVQDGYAYGEPGSQIQSPTTFNRPFHVSITAKQNFPHVSEIIQKNLHFAVLASSVNRGFNREDGKICKAGNVCNLKDGKNKVFNLEKGVDTAVSLVDGVIALASHDKVVDSGLRTMGKEEYILSGESSFSITLWVRKSSNVPSSKEYFLVSNLEGVALLSVDSSGRFKSYMTETEEIFSSNNKPTYYTDDSTWFNWNKMSLAWHSISMVYDIQIGSIRLYLDGVPYEQTHFCTIKRHFTINSFFGFGSKHSQNIFNGYFSTILIYSSPLSENEIKKNYMKLKHKE
jgi:hypothetical protein